MFCCPRRAPALREGLARSHWGIAPAWGRLAGELLRRLRYLRRLRASIFRSLCLEVGLTRRERAWVALEV